MDIFQTTTPTDITIPQGGGTEVLPGSKDTATLDEKQNLSTTTSSTGTNNTLLYIAAGFLAYYLFFKKK